MADWHGLPSAVGAGSAIVLQSPGVVAGSERLGGQEGGKNEGNEIHKVPPDSRARFAAANYGFLIVGFPSR